MGQPLFTNDAIVFGILMISLGFVFYTESKTSGFWHQFYKVVPGLFMAYFIPAIFTTIGAIAPAWETTNASGEVVKGSSQLYYVASRFLLPAALVLMTLSIDLKAIFNLGSKALIMFFTGTVGIIIGGPIAILLISLVSPETVGGADFDRPVSIEGRLISNGEVTVIFDNEPRNKEINKQIEKTIKQGRNVVIWPDSIRHKDINDMIIAGYTKEEIQQIITDNTFSGAAAQLRFAEWRKINA